MRDLDHDSNNRSSVRGVKRFVLFGVATCMHRDGKGKVGYAAPTKYYEVRFLGR